jgi:chaperonin GroES
VSLRAGASGPVHFRKPFRNSILEHRNGRRAPAGTSFAPSAIAWVCADGGRPVPEMSNSTDGLAARVQGEPMSKVAIRPLGEKVLVQRLQAEDITSGGIVLPDSAKEKPKRGTILSVGDGRLLDTGKRQPLQVKKGDQVLFSSYAGTEVKVEGEEMIIMDESDILAVLE